MTLRSLLRAPWHRPIVFLVTLCVCFVPLAALTLAAPKTFEARATLYVSRARGSQEADSNRRYIATYASLASSQNVANDVRRKLVHKFDVQPHVSVDQIGTSQLMAIT